jgi:uncharacterized membrane protein
VQPQKVSRHGLTGVWRWVAMGVRVVVVLALVVLAFVLGRRYLKQQAEAKSPLGILKARLARGEITPEEYEQLRSQIAG